MLGRNRARLLIQISEAGRCALPGCAEREDFSSAFRATVISMAQSGDPRLLRAPGPACVGYGIDAWGLPSVLSALGVLFSMVFVLLLLPLILRDTPLSPAEGSRE